MKISKENQIKRAKRIRFKLKKKPHLRLCSFRSNNHIYVQLIDDEIGKTIVSASSIEKDLRDLSIFSLISFIFESRPPIIILLKGLIIRIINVINEINNQNLGS